MIKLVLIVAIALSPSMQACSCRAIGPKDALRLYDAVFTGHVANVHYTDQPDQNTPRVIVTINVLQSWKGPEGPTIVMHTYRRDGNCEGLPAAQLEVGVKLLVYAYWRVGNDWTESPVVLSTGLCSGTQWLEDSMADLKVLGRPRKSH